MLYNILYYLQYSQYIHKVVSNKKDTTMVLWNCLKSKAWSLFCFRHNSISKYYHGNPTDKWSYVRGKTTGDKHGLISCDCAEKTWGFTLLYIFTFCQLQSLHSPSASLTCPFQKQVTCDAVLPILKGPTWNIDNESDFDTILWLRGIVVTLIVHSRNSLLS